MYVSGKSKYVYIRRMVFLQHKVLKPQPIYERQMNGDCDFFVGVSHGVCQTTEDVINQLKKYAKQKRKSNKDQDGRAKTLWQDARGLLITFQ